MISSVLSLLLSTFKLWIRVCILLVLSAGLYIAFYQWYIPYFITTFPLFFQYDVACTQLGLPLRSTVGQVEHQGKKSLEDCQFVHYDLRQQQRYYFQQGQLYNFELRLVMPDSPVNRNLGMFMVRLRLYDGAGEQLFSIARPALYPYRSMYLRVIGLVFGTVFYWLGLSEESQLLQIALLDEHVHDIESVPFVAIDRIRVEIETYRAIEILPPSHLYVTARLRGVQYWMYFWPVSSFVLVTGGIFCLLFGLYLSLCLRDFLNALQSELPSASDPLVSSTQGELPLPPPPPFEGLSGPLMAPMHRSPEDRGELEDD